MFQVKLFSDIVKSITNKGQTLILAHLMIVFLFSIVYHYILTPADFSNGETITNYLDTLYYTLVTHTLLGYGDIYPKSKRARLVSICHIILILLFLM